MAGSSAVLSGPSAHDTKVTQKYRFPVPCAVSLHLLQQSIASVTEVGSQLGGIAL